METTQFSPSSNGIITKHPQVKIGYYPQFAIDHLKILGHQNPSQTALGLLASDVHNHNNMTNNTDSNITASSFGINGNNNTSNTIENPSTSMTDQDMRALLGSLGLQGRIVSDVPISKLSGGQLVRLALARILWTHPNILILDEVTTHLDYHTVIALIDALTDYEGAVLLVSHDRFMIRKVVEGDMMEADDDSDEEPTIRRRDIYLLKDGQMKLQSGGVGEFEKLLTKMLAKM